MRIKIIFRKINKHQKLLILHKMNKNSYKKVKKILTFLYFQKKNSLKSHNQNLYKIKIIKKSHNFHQNNLLKMLFSQNLRVKF